MKYLSVIMPIYNEKKEWIIESIESILNQTFNDFEFIIIIDNPNNNEAIMLVDYYYKIDKRIKYYVNEKNLGLVKTLNKAISLSNGKFIARMDSDDIALPNRFERQLRYLNDNPDVELVGTNWEFIDENGDILFNHGKLPTNYKFIKKNIKYNNMFLHPSWMFKRSIIERGIKYREIDYCEDYDFITILITNNIIISNINEYLMKYRIRNSSISVSKSYEQFINSCEVINLMKKRLKYNDDNFGFIKINEFNEREKKKFIKASNKFIESRSLLKKKKLLSFIKCFIMSSIISKYRLKKNTQIIIYNIKLRLGNF